MFLPNKKFILAVLLFLSVLVFWAVWEKESQKAEVIFLNVGQGDAMLVKLPGDIQILIDAGPADKIVSKLSEYLPFYDKDIELVLLTHPQSDHLRGFLEVFKNYNVKNLIFTGINYESQTYKNFIALASQENSKIYLAKMGDIISYGKSPVLKIIWPQAIIFGHNFKNVHEANIVSQLNLGGKKFLLMGDADIALEERLLKANALEDIDVLKIGHHGSKTSTSQTFIKKVKPEEAVISVGRNSYGHPTAIILDRLSQISAKIFRTDQTGDVIYSGN
jgi:competence protein ComEC